MALELLFSLPEQAQKECLDGLRSVHKHLSTVEELIWPTLWPGTSELGRGGNMATSATRIDWFFFAKGIPVRLEAKFRPADWPRVSDMGTHQPMKGFFLGKAAKQFPEPSGPLTMHVVGVTGTSELTPDMLARGEDELAESPTVDAILYRTLLGSIHVTTLNEAKAPELAAIVKTPALEEYPPKYELIWHRQSRDERVKQRMQQPQKPRTPSSKLHIIRVDPPESTRKFIVPPHPYMIEIKEKERKPDREPVFIVVIHVPPSSDFGVRTRRDQFRLIPPVP